MFDPQTSGGLLLSIDPARSGALVDALRAAGYPQAAEIGAVEPADGTTLLSFAP
jgi:selenide,water dikinase